MYAVIKTGGKQYRVSAGEKLKIESLPADIGTEIVLDQVLFVGNGEEVTFGTPLVSGATVTARVVGHGRGDKIRIYKMRRRKHYRKSQGHRQNFTEIEIVGIGADASRADVDAAQTDVAPAEVNIAPVEAGVAPESGAAAQVA